MLRSNLGLMGTLTVVLAGAAPCAVGAARPPLVIRYVAFTAAPKGACPPPG